MILSTASTSLTTPVAVGSASTSVPARSAAGATEQASAGREGATAAGLSSAEVTLSAAARMATPQDEDGVGVNSDIDLERVQRVVEAIRNGQYRIDASKIADGLLDSARDLMR